MKPMNMCEYMHKAMRIQRPFDMVLTLCKSAGSW